MEFTTDENRSFSADSPTLLLPALSIGNVGQLAVDLLISSTKAKRIGFLSDPAVIPCVGNDAFGPVPIGDISLPLEAYESSEPAVTFIQQRSPVIKGMMIPFARNASEFIRSIGKKHVVILSSLDLGRRTISDSQNAIQIYYISSIGDNADPDFENFGWKKFDLYDPSQRRWKYLSSLARGDSPPAEMFDDDDELTDSDYSAGFPFAALFSFCKEQGLKVTCLLCYCSEGDNIGDSFLLANAACKLLGESREKLLGNEHGGWAIPLSWQTVYGPPPDMTLF